MATSQRRGSVSTERRGSVSGGNSAGSSPRSPSSPGKKSKLAKNGKLSNAVGAMMGAMRMKKEAANTAEAKKAADLAKDLDSIDVAKKLKAADELANMPEAVVEPHFPILARRMWDENMAVRLRVAACFGRFPKGAAPHADALAERLAYADQTVRERAGQQLAQMGDLGADVLSQRLDHNSEDVRKAALEHLASMGPGAGCVAEAVTDMLEDDCLQVRLAAMRCLGAIGPAAGPYVPILAEELKNPDPVPRETCAEAMGKIGEASAPYAEMLAKQLHPGQYCAMAPDGAPALGDVLKVRTTANESLKLMAAEGALAVSRRLRHTDSRVRVSASQSLGQMGPVATPYGEGIAAQLVDPDPIARARAVETLGLMGAAAAQYSASIASLLWDSDSGVRRAAAEALEQVNEAKGLGFNDAAVQSAIKQGEVCARKAYRGGSGLHLASDEANAVMKWWHPVQ
eukprot:TRINITY_DN56380_c0_g1_i1.p1 TRINITY_DN56380_c0_g1~~TRINITY_DN56380_c0_g1_i1.p1  ORF type:complete len:457 (-),score=109.97 TRINITY_DN56380_c0_g1_i1:118-1488(-)